MTIENEQNRILKTNRTAQKLFVFIGLSLPLSMECLLGVSAASVAVWSERKCLSSE